MRRGLATLEWSLDAEHRSPDSSMVVMCVKASLDTMQSILSARILAHRRTMMDLKGSAHRSGMGENRAAHVGGFGVREEERRDGH